MSASKGKNSSTSKVLLPMAAFVLGCMFSASVVLSTVLSKQDTSPNPVESNLKSYLPPELHPGVLPVMPLGGLDSSTQGPLHGLRILVAIAAFDFSQIPHLEEVLDSYHDLCVTGAAKVDVVIHSTVPYPVTLIDMLNTRIVPGPCSDIFSLKVILKPSNLRLHLVDCHRPLFYEHIDDYDLFIYTEDDIRVTPKTVGAYMEETNRLKRTLGTRRAADFNVGIVRYEYNFPSNVVIDDKTSK